MVSSIVNFYLKWKIYAPPETETVFRRKQEISRQILFSKYAVAGEAWTRQHTELARHSNCYSSFISSSQPSPAQPSQPSPAQPSMLRTQRTSGEFIKTTDFHHEHDGEVNFLGEYSLFSPFEIYIHSTLMFPVGTKNIYKKS